MADVASRKRVARPAAAVAKLRRSSDSAARAYDALKIMVESYALKPGERVNEIEVARQLDLSRTPVRQALARLGSEGYIEQTPNRGYYVRSISVRDIQDLYELRSIVEVGAFRLACERGTEEGIEAMASAWYRHRDMPEMSIDGIAIADENFHRDIALLSGNSRIVETLDRINSLIGYFRRIDLDMEGTRNWKVQLVDDHTSMIESLRARDVDKGSEIMRAHVSISSEHSILITKESVARIFMNSDGMRESAIPMESAG